VKGKKEQILEDFMSTKKWTKKEIVDRAPYPIRYEDIEWIEKGKIAKIYNESTRNYSKTVLNNKKKYHILNSNDPNCWMYQY
jgi:hypothetical protein